MAHRDGQGPKSGKILMTEEPVVKLNGRSCHHWLFCCLCRALDLPVQEAPDPSNSMETQDRAGPCRGRQQCGHADLISNHRTCLESAHTYDIRIDAGYGVPVISAC